MSLCGVMRRAQGSLEYLLILAAILAIAVVVVIVATSLLSNPQSQTEISQAKYEAALQGVEFIGYDSVFDGTLATAPLQIVKQGEAWSNPQISFVNPSGTEYIMSLSAYGEDYPLYGDIGGGDYHIVIGGITAVTNGLVGYWSFEKDEGTTAVDWSGNGNNGTINGDQEYVQGKHGKALKFDGNDYIVIPNNNDLQVGTGAITVSHWMKPSVLDEYMVTFYGGGFGGSEGYGVGLQNEERPGDIRYEIRDYTSGVPGPRYLETDTLIGISLSEWNHIVTVFDGPGEVMKVYLNGVEKHSEAISVTDVQNQADFAIGTYVVSEGIHTYYFKGGIDDVRVYNRVLTQEEILELAS